MDVQKRSGSILSMVEYSAKGICTHFFRRAKPNLESEIYDDFVDKNLENNYKMESLKRVACIATKCVERNAVYRPLSSRRPWSLNYLEVKEASFSLVL